MRPMWRGCRGACAPRFTNDLCVVGRGEATFKLAQGTLGAIDTAPAHVYLAAAS